MVVEYNEPELKEKLLRVYTQFVEDPTNSKNLERIKELDGKYASLSAANDYIASKPIPNYISEAVGFLHKTYAYAYGETQEELVKEAKKILEELRKSE